MKAIIYAGIGLFSVATVYGVADFYSSKKKGTLDKLYVEEEIPASSKVEEKTTVALPENNNETIAVENATTTAKTKSTKKARRQEKMIKMEDFSRARIPEPVVKEDELILEPVKKEEVIVVPVKQTVVPEEKVEAKPEERVISLEKFSRAPLKKSSKKMVVKNKKVKVQDTRLKAQER